uniref:WH2 domain-containing protein n=1 Tax=Syphacia muris TaxID=451379 RepID=A0A0N5AAH6_9BILA
MFMGHPILDEIRQGHQLRPTQTVDKSKPILVADGETFFKNFSASNVRGTIPIVPSTQIPTVTPANPQSCSTSPPPVPCASPPPILFVPPPPVVPPPLPPNLPVAAKVPSKTTNKSALMKLGGNQNVDRDELLRSIRNGVKLRKTQTLDKSIPVVQAEIETREPASSSLTLEKSDS